ncbi:MAG TPA: hypothetical protein PKW33_16795 [Anaerolineaceae bacterium]|nr:hypothetical protein [Anaerolineaceae bacterium]HPN53257.1 hypothetical protein [Anaerolineaceae bacterium]
MRETFEETQQRILTLRLFLQEGEWYDFWHIHPAIYGDGSADLPDHRRYIALSMAFFERIRSHANGFKMPWQSWVIVDPLDSTQDAVYFHTPNPHQRDFPFSFQDVTWNIETPELLDGLVDLNQFEIGESFTGGTVLYWIRPKEKIEAGASPAPTSPPQR